ncbi:MAG: response regulator [Gammaproteobacteria bacterium]|nr:response regulator [Gammaproteobacteria bacterium]MBT3489243.1 response regulator [Gammaproteobacteria bacterium]MBT3718530.1 response regulator [Gammaproteobacteria bacterium]MBT3846018.1 response regulator [Gammaproteobacteria bacterium]MBT3892727.1 response regulator [Gammaproteobacteria bacterium]
MVELLLIDDEESIYESVKLYLEPPELEDDPFAFLDDEPESEPEPEEDSGGIVCKVHWVPAGTQGLQMVEEAITPFDLILVDMNMPPGWNGVQTIEQIRAIDPKVPIALVTANMSADQTIQTMLTEHTVRLFHKPYSKTQLYALVEEMTA